MPVHIVLDHPDHGLVGRAGRAAGAFAGGALLLVGLVVSLVPVVLAGRVGLQFLTEDSAGIDLNQLMRLAVISAVVALVALLAGLVLLRGRRWLVLFLRNFGHQGATAAVTFAAAKTIGSSWRLVTLDNADIAPVGVAAWPRTLAVIAYRVRHAIGTENRRIRRVISYAFQLAYSGGWLVVIYLSVSRDAWGAAVLDYLFELFSAAEEVRMPALPADSDLRTAVVFLLVTGLTFVVAPRLLRLLSTVVHLLLLIPNRFVTSSATAVRRAEEATRAQIRTNKELGTVTREIARQARRIIAPRLVVLRTDNALWRDAVRQLAAISTVTLVDVSKPTDNLLWELRELADRFGSRWLLVGQYDQVRHLAEDDRDALLPGSLDAQLADLLDGHQILAYTTDRRGQRRFAQALRARFSALSRAAAPKGH